MSLLLGGSCNGELKVKGFDGLEIVTVGPETLLGEQNEELPEEGDEMEIEATDL